MRSSFDRVWWHMRCKVASPVFSFINSFVFIAYFLVFPLFVSCISSQLLVSSLFGVCGDACCGVILEKGLLFKYVGYCLTNILTLLVMLSSASRQLYQILNFAVGMCNHANFWTDVSSVWSRPHACRCCWFAMAFVLPLPISIVIAIPFNFVLWWMKHQVLAFCMQ